MNSNLSSYLDVDHIKGHRFGIEIEVENFPEGYEGPEPKLLRIKPDGSLRNNGVEYVSRKPYTIAQTLCAIDEYIAETVRYGSECFKHNDRTSVHLHVNCSDMDHKQLGAMIVLALTAERSMFKKYGQGREANNYCVPYYWRHQVLRDVLHYANMMMVGMAFHLPPGDKYSSINFSTLSTFQTIEFRMCEGTNERDVLRSLVKDVAIMRRTAVHSKYTDANEVIAEQFKAGTLSCADYDLLMSLLTRKPAPKIVMKPIRLRAMARFASN